jgi:hypothetical protein
MPRVERDDYIPEDLMLTLQKKIPGFRNESEKHQWALTKMVWFGGSKRRQHTHFDEAMSFTYQELEQNFGRGGFEALNQRLNFFKVSNQWFHGRGQTKGYWFTDTVKQVRDSYIKTRWRKNTRLLLANGKELETVPAAVASKDMKGATTTAWKSAKQLNTVRVDLDSMKRLRKWLQVIQSEWQSGLTPHDLVTEYPPLDVIDRLLDCLAQVTRMSKTDVAGHGIIPQRYVQSKSGRLYAKGINLQNTPSLIKQAALHGLWEYDIENCHFVILEQMAAGHGYQCQAIANYLANKKQTRQAIAEQADTTIEQTKTCLLALMYGARRSEWHANAIPEAIGQDRAKRLYQVPLFNGIAEDINRAKDAILKGHKRTRGLMVNAFGKSIKASAPPNEILAHLIQGVEALALKTVIDLYPNDIVLLQHDGFAATTRLDDKAIIEALYKVTGYRFNLEESLIRIDPDAQFQKAIQKARFQNKNRRKARPGAGFRQSHAS